MKVLIVDDNKNNRMILRLLLEEYSNDNKDVGFKVSEAEDGLIAVEKVKENNFDLIFMDIMMPNMDGIAATSAIRRIDKIAMIIAVSAVDDDQRKKTILNIGAEDYVSKPVNGDVFNARLKSYLKLINSRHGSQSAVSKPLNIFGEKTYSYDLHFNGENEDMLSSFWEYYLLNNTPYEGISDMVRFVYDMALEALKESSRVDIYEENSDDFLFLTLVSPQPLDPDLIMHYADKNDFVENYKLEGEVLSTKLKKEKVVNFIEPIRSNEIIAPKIEKACSIESKPVKLTKKENFVFDFLEPEDFDDLQEYISKLNSLLLILGSTDMETHEVDEIVMTLLQISRSVTGYSDLYNISSALGSLGNTIHSYEDSFLVQSENLGPLAKAFGGDLSHWFKSLFLTGATSIDFLDASIISNALMIENFIKPQEESAEAVDDIFDF